MMKMRLGEQRGGVPSKRSEPRVGMQRHHLPVALASGVISMLIACDGGGAASSGGRAPGSGGARGSMSVSGEAGLGGGGSVGGARSGVGYMDASSQDGVTGMDAGIRGADGGARGRDGSVREPDGSASATYACSLILGIATTSEWFSGFEQVVDNARWELKFQDSAHIEKWADPANAVWSLPITSPCAENADKPDRVVFMGVNYDYATVDLFLPKYIAVLNNIKTKYPSVERLDVMTYTRGPGNKECVGANRSNDSYIKPVQDEAIAMFSAMYPDFVFPAPHWEVQSCSDFGLCPHLTGPANAVLSKIIGTYFLTH